MDATDYGTFETAFKRLSSAFRFKPAGGDSADLPRTYFRLLEDYPLSAVLEAGRACAKARITFPKPAEWIAAIVRPDAPTDARQMTVDELEERAAAHQARYTSGPCLCSECCRAGVDERDVRFVPTLAGDDDERAYNPRRKALEIVGHWAHGEELARWYAAREACLSMARVRYPKFARHLQFVTPGDGGVTA